MAYTITTAKDFIKILSKHQCVSVRIDIKKDFPISIGKEYTRVTKSESENERADSERAAGKHDKSEKHEPYANLSDMVNSEDFTSLIERIDELATRGEGSMRVNCRFKPNDNLYLICCEMRRDKRLGRVYHYLQGVIMDIAEFNRNMISDPTQQELLRRSLRLDPYSDPKHIENPGIVEIVGREQLSRMQLPLGSIDGLHSALVDKDRKFLCSADLSQTGFAPDKYEYAREFHIKISHTLYAIWILASNDAQLVEEHARLHDTLAENLNRLANAYVLLYKEMVSTERANKMLSETIEQQILLNGIYTKVLNEKNTTETVRSIIGSIGDFLKLDRIFVYSDIPELEKYDLVHDWACGNSESPVPNSESFVYSDYPKLVEELNEYDIFYSGTAENNLFGLEFASYAAANLSGDGAKYGIIIYVSLEPSRVFTNSEKRLIRSGSQIVTAVIMRCRDNEELEGANKRLQQLAYYDQVFDIKNRTMLEYDIFTATTSGWPGAVITFRLPNIESINNFKGRSESDRLIKAVLDFILYLSSIGNYVSEPYRYSDAVFLILLQKATPDTVKTFCEDFVKRFRTPWLFEGNEHYLEVTAGAALYPNVGTKSDELCRAAAMAMNKALEYGVNSYAFFSGSVESLHTDDYYCSQLLRDAVETNMTGLDVEFVPMYSKKSENENRAVSYEVRPVLALPMELEIYPSRVVMQIAEKTGVDSAIDAWVLKRACSFCAAAREKIPHVTVSVIISARTLTLGKTIHMVKAALTESGLPADGLTVRFTEKTIATNYDSFLTALGELCRAGVAVALDGVGSYYSAATLFRHSGITAARADITLFTSQIDSLDKKYITDLMALARANQVDVSVDSVADRSLLELIGDVDLYSDAKAVTEKEALDSMF